MISILKAQLYRLKKSKTFWVIFIINAALPIIGSLFILGIEAIFKTAGNDSFLELLGLIMGSATSALAGFASWTSDSTVLAIICAAIILSREFTQGTMRNAVLANKSRTHIFLAYYIIALLIGGIYYLTEFVLRLGLYGAILGFGIQSAADATTTTFTFFALGLCSTLVMQTCVCLFLFTTRKQSLTIALPLLIALLVPSLTQAIIELILSATEYAGNVVSEATKQCIPLYNMSMLDSIQPSGLNAGMIALYDILFAGVFFVSAFFPFLKTDLK